MINIVGKFGFKDSASILASEAVDNLDYVYMAGDLYLQHLESESLDQKQLLYNYRNRFIPERLDFMLSNYEELSSLIDSSRSRGFKYSSIKDLASNYLVRDGERVVEDMQWLWMRVAVQCGYRNMKDIIDTYDGLSKGEFIHATPTCVNACLRCNSTDTPQLESCFLVAMGDEMKEIGVTMVHFLMGSKNNGGFGVDVGRIRHSQVANRGKTKGIPGLLQIWNNLVPYADQLGSRPGACTIFFPIHHMDAPIVLKMKDKNSSVQAVNLNYAVVIPDIFMHRVEQKGRWHITCPRLEQKLWVRMNGGDDNDGKDVDKAPCLHDLHGEEFNKFYLQCEEAAIGEFIDAEDIWTKINTYRSTFGAPFIMFKDNVNRKSNHIHLGTVTQSNLCVRGDTVILTERGYLPIKALAEDNEDIRVWNGKEWSITRPMMTGENQHLLTVSFSNGSSIHCTDYHKFPVSTTKDKFVFKEASKLKIGDKLLKCDFPIVKSYDEEEDSNFGEYAYTHGFFCADGTYSNKKPYLRLYNEKEKLLEHLIIRGEAIRETGAQIRLCCKLHTDIPNKFHVPLRSSIETKLKWLSGYLDGDGCVSKMGNYHCIQVVSIEKKFLDDIKMMLQTLGCNPKYTVSKEGKTNMPMNDGTDRYKDYNTKVSWRMVISTKDLITLHKLGLDTKRLVYSVPDSLVQKDTSRFVKVVSVLDEGEHADTYCFNESKRNMGIFNGIISSQCTEITQYTKPGEIAASCDLATINLTKFLLPNGKINWIKMGEITRLITRNLNRVIDQTSGIMPNEGQKMCDKYPDHPLVQFVMKDPAHTGRMMHRAIGIGAMGYASLLSLMELDYGSREAEDIGITIRACIYYHSMDESVNLAQSEGPCQSWYGSPLSRGILHQDLYREECESLNRHIFSEIDTKEFGISTGWDYLRSRVKLGTRNSLTTCQMPNSTTSSVLGVSPGFEPFFDVLYSSSNVNGSSMNVYDSFRTVMQRFNLYDPIILARHLRANKGSVDKIEEIFPHVNKEIISKIKSIFRNGFSINKRKMLFFYQRMGVYIDMAQSTNIFFSKPNALYLGELTKQAWKNGCKTLYYLHRRTTDKISLQSSTVAKKVDNTEDDVCPIDCTSCQ